MPTAQLRGSASRRVPATLNVKKGAQVLCDGRAARVLAVVGPTAILVNFLGTDEQAFTTVDALSGFVEARYVEAEQPPIDPAPSSEKLQRAQAWVKQFRALKGLNFLEPLIRARIASAMQASERTVGRRFGWFLSDPSPQHQLVGRPGPSKGASYFPRTVDAIIAKTIEEVFESAEKPTVEAVMTEARRRCRAAGFKHVISRTAIDCRIRKRDRTRAARRRHGRVRGMAKAGPAGPQTPMGNVLDFVQMDHAICDIMLVDDVDREVIGRPWITLAIELLTRVVLGFYLSFDAPSQASVALALEHACCPKDAWLKSIGYSGGAWIPMGLMRRMGWDNGKCFKPTRLGDSCRLHGIEPVYRQVRTPTHGAHIERLIGTFMGQLHLLKGTTFSNPFQRGDYNSEARATMGMREFLPWCAHQINGVYHNTEHRALDKRSPLESWDEVWTRNGEVLIPPIPADRRAFRLSLMPGVYRKVTREGLNRFGLKYWDDALIPFMCDDQRYWVPHDPRDVSKIFLQANDDYFDVPWRDQTRRPISLMELQWIKRKLKLEHIDARNETVLFEHLAKMHELEAAAERLTKEVRRRRETRPADTRTPEAMASRLDYTAPSTVDASALRYSA